MKAVWIREFGGAENLEVREIADLPAPAADRVLIRVKAAALNRADLLQRRGLYPAPKGFPQEIPGLEFAGEIAAIGDAVENLKVGQRVFGITAGAAQAEFVSAPENTLLEIPANLNFTEAAAVPEAFITAHDALFTQGELTIGERVGIHAVGSGVGLAAVQLARAAGAQTMGTARTESKLDAAQEFGLDEGVLVSEDSQAFVAAVCEWTRDAGIHIILDLVGASLFQANLEALAPRGRLLLVGSLGGSRAEMDWGLVMRKRLRLMGTVLRARSREEKARAVRLFAAQVVPLLERQTVRPVIDSVFDLTDVWRAHERMESNESFGKIVLRIE
jgi:putative PIG3 family NAD(P)H quinone oxidoreductase